MLASTLRKITPRVRLVAAVAILLYCAQGLLLIAQKPGLQYDEALLVASAVHMRHSAKTFEMESTPNAWVCPFGRCIPLMSALYIGPVKAYASLPLFFIFGPRTPVIRLVSLLLGALAIWGIYCLMIPWFRHTVAAVSALALAIDPTFVNMVVFDNNAVAALMAGLGLTFIGVASYSTRKSTIAAFWLGAALGFGVWCRANFIWLLVAGTLAAVIVFRRRVLIPISHASMIVLGGIIGGFPFLLYQFVSGGATWKAQSAFAVSQPMALLLRERLFLFADMLLFDGESRSIWAGPPLPAWQIWFFPTIVFAGCLVCLFAPRAEDRAGKLSPRFLALNFLIAAAFLFFSRLQVAEHHLVILLPLGVAVVVAAYSILQVRFARVTLLSATLFVVYGFLALYWQVQEIRGLRNSGGVGVWSNSIVSLAKYLDEHFAGQDIDLLDWGFKYNLYDLTNGRLKVREIYASSAENKSYVGRSWMQEISPGGVFVMAGPQMRTFPKPTAGFLRVLSAARPRIDRYTVRQRDGAIYARVLDISPVSAIAVSPPARSSEVKILMGDSQFDGLLSGFYPPEPGGFRWTKREFSVRLPALLPGVNGTDLALQFYIPDGVIEKVGSITLTATFAGHPLPSETFSRPGQHVFRRELVDAWMGGQPMQIDFSLDKVASRSGPDRRELGIVVKEIAIEPE